MSSLLRRGFDDCKSVIPTESTCRKGRRIGENGRKEEIGMEYLTHLPIAAPDSPFLSLHFWSHSSFRLYFFHPSLQFAWMLTKASLNAHKGSEHQGVCFSELHKLIHAKAKQGNYWWLTQFKFSFTLLITKKILKFQTRTVASNAKFAGSCTFLTWPLLFTRRSCIPRSLPRRKVHHYLDLPLR